MELLIALTITAMLLSATMLAIDASFTAYAVAAKSASTQTTTRLTVHRLLKLIRTSTLHGPVRTSVPAEAEWSDWPVLLGALEQRLQATRGVARPAVTPQQVNQFTLTSRYFRIWDPEGNQVMLTYVNETNELWLTTLAPGDETAHARPLLGGVTEAEFTLHRRLDEAGLWRLKRGSAAMTVVADNDTTLKYENGQQSEMHVVASTMPRKLE